MQFDSGSTACRECERMYVHTGHTAGCLQHCNAQLRAMLVCCAKHLLPHLLAARIQAQHRFSTCFVTPKAQHAEHMKGRALRTQQQVDTEAHKEMRARQKSLNKVWSRIAAGYICGNCMTDGRAKQSI